MFQRGLCRVGGAFDAQLKAVMHRRQLHRYPARQAACKDHRHRQRQGLHLKRGLAQHGKGGGIGQFHIGGAGQHGLACHHMFGHPPIMIGVNHRLEPDPAIGIVVA